MTKTPLIILAKDRPVQLVDMLKSIEQYTDPNTYEIIICDNASTQPDMMSFLEQNTNRYNIYRNTSNMLFEGFNIALQNHVHGEYFMISDPDIVLQKGIPYNWVELFIKFLDRYNDVPKIGVALNYHRIPFDKIPSMASIVKWEQEKQRYPKYCGLFEDPYYDAHIDTTLCMMRRDTYQSWKISEQPQFRPGVEIMTTNVIKQRYNSKYRELPVRVGGRFTSMHIGWEMATNDRYQQDYEYYLESLSGNKISSTICNLRGEKQI